MLTPTHYHFESGWRVRADPGDVWDVLYDVPSYVQWWPQVKQVGALRERTETYDVAIRSALPYTIRVVLTQRVADRDAGVLYAGLSGDLEGWSRWTIRRAPAGSVLTFEEDVVTTRAVFNLLAPVARPAFQANHWWMMRDGERGLRTFMAGHRFGREGPLGKHQEAEGARGRRRAQA